MCKSTLRSAMAICCVCIFFLMCAFFVDETYAASTVKGTTTRKEQTIKLNLSAGTAVITVKDVNSWVFAQLQKTGSNKIGTAVNGDVMLANLGQKKTFTVPVKSSGKYFLYLHGTNKGADYKVRQIRAGGALKSGVAKLGTSYADNTSIVYYRIKVPGNGTLRVTAKDASYRYPGYSKVQLKLDDKLLAGEEHLIKGLGYSTIYGVHKGTYRIGVRSSSELYNLTATFLAKHSAKYGSTRKTAVEIGRKEKAWGVIYPGNKTVRWYKVVIPEKTDRNHKSTITVRSYNNIANIKGGVKVLIRYSSKRKNKRTAVKKRYMLNNSEKELTFNARVKHTRTIYVGVAPVHASGSYYIYWR